MSTLGPFGAARLAGDAWLAAQGRDDAWRDRQATRLAELVRFARERSPIYRSMYRHLPDAEPRLSDLPVVSKSLLMASFDQWPTDAEISLASLRGFMADASRVGEPYLSRYLVCTSSGTTGVPGVFLHDSSAIAVYQALLMTRSYLRWVSPGLALAIARRGVREAMVLSTGGHFAAVGWMERSRRLHPRLSSAFRTFAVTDPLPRLCQQLAEFQPTLLVSYPSALALLAREKSAGRLPIAPLLVASAGESFTETMRQRIEAGFGLPLRDSYGASEFLYLAFGCAQGWLHVHADWAVLEPVDAAYQPVSPGQPSHTVLLTNLANRVQPLIRYDLGDSVLFRPDPCPCGSPLPAIRVRGREADLLVFRSADDHDMPVLPLALATIIEESPAVHRFQAIQTGPDWLEIRLEVAAGADPAAVWDELASRLDRWLRSLGLANVKVRRSPEGPQADPVSGKLRQVFATWRPEQGDLAVSGTGLDGQAPRTDQVRGL